MAPKFGTSGVRGLVAELSDDVVTGYVTSFLQTCDTAGQIFVGRDLRESSPRIAETTIQAALSLGHEVFDCGVLPTPALALAAGQAGAGAIMVTGSHIPADRNGIKFYTVAGEILKADESRIVANLQSARASQGRPPAIKNARDRSQEAAQLYTDRYVSAFPTGALSELRIGLYQHSSVARDILHSVFSSLGATVIPLERTSEFVPVDTEAVDEATQQKFATWCATENLDALVSTDGDADRPMLADAKGKIVAGDILGALTARALGADQICTPISSNTMIQSMDVFTNVALTKIGSPYVVAAIEDVLRQDPKARVVGYEANGGFLLGFEARSGAGRLAPLLTRDCTLPLVAVLAEARRNGQSVSELVSTLPARFTAANRVIGITPAQSMVLIESLASSHRNRQALFGSVFTGVTPQESVLDQTDGLRVAFQSGDIIHLRPSGNAPELRCYAESVSDVKAQNLVRNTLAAIKARLAA